MKITIFTSNKLRHNYLVNSLLKIGNVYVFQESTTHFPGINESRYKVNKYIADYFTKVNSAQNKFFKKHVSIYSQKNLIKIVNLSYGDLNKIKINNYNDFFKSDIYIVFGSSFIKGELLSFLIKQKAINIHMGISPFYTGTDCNFWALFDGNPELVGATIHYLSKELDIGPIIYHATSEVVKNPFEYSMSTVKSAVDSIKLKLLNKSLLDYKNIDFNFNNTFKNIRHSKKIDFTPTIAKTFLNRKINLNKVSNHYNLVNNFKLKKNDYFSD